MSSLVVDVDVSVTVEDEVSPPTLPSVRLLSAVPIELVADELACAPTLPPAPIVDLVPVKRASRGTDAAADMVASAVTKVGFAKAMLEGAEVSPLVALVLEDVARGLDRLTKEIAKFESRGIAIDLNPSS